MQSLAGKVAVVTGAARGIGRAVAFWVARKGTNIVVNYLQTVNSCFVVIESEKMGGVGQYVEWVGRISGKCGGELPYRHQRWCRMWAMLRLRQLSEQRSL